MKKILVLAGRYPYPLDDGWKIRTFHLLQALSQMGGEVDLLVFDETGNADLGKALKSLCRKVVVIKRDKAYSPGKLLRGLLPGKPFSVLNYADPAFAEALEVLVAENDYGYVQVEDIVLAQYVEGLAGVVKVLDMHNIESELLRRYAKNCGSVLKGLYARMTAAKLERYELKIAEAFDGLYVCSADEKAELRRKGARRPIEVVPNGVDSSFYESAIVEKEENAVVFVGSMDYHANISGIKYYASEVLPRLLAVFPGLKTYVVGKNPPPDIRALADDNLIVTGAVDDVRPYLGRGQISIVPLLVGGGTRLKILEAMAAGLPVVSTSVGAEGLEVAHGEQILLGDTAETFADGILSLLRDKGRRRSIAENGRKFVKGKYDWPVIAVLLQTHLAELFGEKI